MSRPQYHVAIIGAGLGGLAAAIGISRAGHKVTIIEQAAVLGEIGAGIQIPPNSSRILKRWGLLPKVEEVSVRPREFVLRSYRDGAVLSKQNMVPYAVEKYGVPYLHVHRADYHKILVDEAQRSGVQIQLGSTVTSIDFEKPSVFIRDKPEFEVDIVIGADGLKSRCREKLLGKPDPPKLTGDLAYRIVVSREDMLKHENLVDLAENPAINYWMGPEAHAVCYLLKGGGLYNIVLICPDNLPEMVNTAKADVREMNEFFAKWDPRLRTLLSIVKETSKWRLQNSEEMKTWSHPSGKFALMGDACHATLPYLAQGAAMAVEDGAVLGALMEKIEHRSQLKDVLVIYERLRKERTTRVVKRSTALRETFHLPDGERQAERDRQLLEEEPFEDYPNRWADPVFQPFLFAYDAHAEVEQAWEVYKKGAFPGTYGQFRANL
ncbi:hypothetical protein B0A49_11351 [Cryomyces minteri]|uniref:FAD-binding domain-containing protein n=1 Tax=Cryomyces minteri TaxID=331657 RepID=A0A4U0WG44_9PEZI|nr:hypothetical protein B0A49_11351 [Cryomyces minteri]